MLRWILPLLLTGAACSAASADFEKQWELIREQASPTELYRLLYAMPKGGDLHNHLGLSIRPEEWLAVLRESPRKFYTRLSVGTCQGDQGPFLKYAVISAHQWRQLPPCSQQEYTEMGQLTDAQKSAWISACKLDRPGEGRDEFFEYAVNRLLGLNRDLDLYLAASTKLLQRYSHEKIRYLEAQGGAFGYEGPDGTLLSEEVVATKVRNWLASDVVRATGVTVRMQITIVRFRPEAEASIARAYAFIAKNRDIWVGVNLAGREDNDKGNALRFLPTFRMLRRKYSGIRLSIHGGEVDAPGQEVRNTLLLGAERIGHGFNLITDPDTMLLLRNGKTLLEVSLVSNQLLEYASDLNSHPFPEYLRFGVPVCLNTDDQGTWDSQLTDDFYHAVKHFNLSWAEIRQLSRNSLLHSFLEEDDKRKLLADYDREFESFTEQLRGPDWRTRLQASPLVPSGYAQRILKIANSF